MPKILLLEPHPDDCLLSAYYLLRAYNENFTFDTVTIESKNYRNGAAFFNNEFRCRILSYTECIPTEVFDSKLAIGSKKKEVLDVDAYYLDKYENIYRDLYAEASNLLARIDPGDYDLIISPLGVAHQTHIITRVLATKLFPMHKLRFYRDVPYCNKAYGKKHEKYLISKLNLEIACKRDITTDELEFKKSLIKLYYPSELGIMHPLYEMPNFLKNMYEIMYKSI